MLAPVGALSSDLHVDVETRSEVDLREVGLDVYAQHPSTDIMMVAWRLGGEPIKQWTFNEGLEPPDELVNLLRDPGITKWAHNAQFERVIFKHIWGVDVPIREWRCSMALAYMLGLPGALEKLGPIVRMPAQHQKHEKGRYYIKKFCSPRKPTKKKPWRWCTERTDPVDWAGFCAYNRQDVDAEHYLVTHRLGRYEILEEEWGMWFLDQEINERGVAIDVDYVDKCIKIIDEKTASLVAALRALTDLDNPNSDTQFGPWVRNQGYEFGDLQKDTVKRAVADPESRLNESARAALDLRRQLKKTAVKKYYTTRLMVADDGRLRYQYQFCGAKRTGRWAGRGAQPQNQAKPIKAYESKERQTDIIESVKGGYHEYLRVFYPDIMTTLSSTVRGCIVAPPGRKLVIADLSSIESRFLAWIAKCERKLQDFFAGRDPYKAFAAIWFGISYEDVTKEQRNLSKSPELGCGFRLSGGEEVVDRKTGDLKKTGLWAYAERNGSTLTREQAHEAVAVFREAYPEIVEHWYHLENAARTVILHGGVESVGPVSFDMIDPFLRMTLPSGRRLHYLRPKIESRKTPWGAERMTITYEGQQDDDEDGHSFWGRIPTHGGKFTENEVQGGANCILRVGMTEAHDEGFEIVLHAHDEIAAEVDEDDDYLTVRLLEQCMIRKRSWMEGLPLGAAGFETKFYMKAE